MLAWTGVQYEAETMSSDLNAGPEEDTVELFHGEMDTDGTWDVSSVVTFHSNTGCYFSQQLPPEYRCNRKVS